VAIDVPKASQGGHFTWLLLLVALLVWLGFWLCWRWWRSGKSVDWATKYLPVARLRWLAPSAALIGLAAFIAIQFHPMMPIFRHLLWKVFFT
jgi:hypothetical protein